MPKPATNANYKIIAWLMIAIMLLSACQKEFLSRPTLSPTLSPTITHTATITPTSTTVPTITPTPSKTPTPTLTPYPSRTRTATATAIAQRPARLFEFYAGGDHMVDWGYSYISEKGMGMDDKVNQLTAMFAFQLMDRGIHAKNVRFLDEDITVYYLNVSHEFDGEAIPMRLLIGGTYGQNVPVKQIPADGSAYIEFLEVDSDQVFEPWRIHREAQLPYEERQAIFTSMLMQDFEQFLSALPDELIILAEHPILWPKDDWTQVKLDMSRLSSMAARYLPFFSLDVYEHILGPSESASALAAYLLADASLPEGEIDFSAQVLIFVTP
jgi:hypothetical protein